MSGLSPFETILGVAALSSLAVGASAQELEPGAYSISPVGVNIVIAAHSFASGDLSFDPTLPIQEAEASLNTTVVGFVRALDVFGRSANLGVVLPYTVGGVQGIYIGEFTEVHRSGLRDPQFRFAVNLLGGPAMNAREFASYRQKTNLGVSLVVSAPLGEYDGTKLINLGTNRWGLKPEVGLSQALGKWTLELYGGVWLFTDNSDFFGGRTREQAPIGAGQVHLLYTFRRRLWAAFNANFYTGGRTRVDGQLNLDLQRNARVGGTVSFPLTGRQSLKLAYSRGAYTTIGADFDAFVVGYQYLWGAGL